MALSPWPRDPDGLTAATATLREVLPDTLTDGRIQSLGATAALRVEHYSPRAPQPAKDTAVEMYAGYLAQSNPGPVTKIDVGNVNIERQINHAAAFRHSGAMAMLSPWKIRRAGAIDNAPATPTENEVTNVAEQLPSIELSTTPVNIADGLPDGQYQFQAQWADADAFVLYAYGDSAPSLIPDYFTADPRDIVPFTVRGGTRLWARLGDNVPSGDATLALARLS